MVAWLGGDPVRRLGKEEIGKEEIGMVARLGAEYPNKKREMLRKDLASLIPDSSSGVNYAVFDSFLFFYEVLLHQ